MPGVSGLSGLSGLSGVYGTGSGIGPSRKATALFPGPQRIFTVPKLLARRFPALTLIAPNTASPGAPDTTITLTGTFFPTSTAYFGTLALVTTYLTPVTMTAVIPAAQLVGASTTNVTVQDNAGTSQAQVFTVAGPIPGPTFSVPGGSPAAPGEVYTPPTGGAVGTMTLVNCTPQGIQGDVLNVMVDVAPSDLTFLAYSGGDLGLTNVTILGSDSVVASLPKSFWLLIPASLKTNSAYTIWPYSPTQGYGLPFVVNKTNALWAQFSSTGRPSGLVGDSVYVGGSNLAGCLIYLVPSGMSSFNGPYTPTATTPELAVFTMPSLATGVYEVWAHNQKGGKYGWSKVPGNITLSTAAVLQINYSVFTYTMPAPTGGDDLANMNTAKAAVIASGGPGTIVFQSNATYNLSSVHFSATGNLLLQGNNTTIQTAAGFNDDMVINFVSNVGGVTGIKISTAGGTVTTNRNASGVLGGAIFTNVIFDTRNVTNWCWAPAGNGATLNGCTFIGTGVFIPSGNSNVILANNSFYLANGAAFGGCVTIWGTGADFIVYKNNAQSLDQGTYTNDGRFLLASQGSVDSLYCGENTFNLYDNSGDVNRGEKIVSEVNAAKQSSMVASATANTIVFTDALLSWATSYTAGSLQFAITDGTGATQWGLISAVNSGTKTLTVSNINGSLAAFLSIPDATSRCNVFAVASRWFCHNNVENGGSALDGTASAGFALFGGGLGCIVDSNVVNGTNYLLNVASGPNPLGAVASCPLGWNLFLNNSGSDIGGNGTVIADKGPATSEKVVTFGNVFRGNSTLMRVIAGATQNSINLVSATGTMKGTTFDKHFSVNATTGMLTSANSTPATKLMFSGCGIALEAGNATGSVAITANTGYTITQTPAGQFTGFGGAGAQSSVLTSPARAWVVAANGSVTASWQPAGIEAKYRLYRSTTFPVTIVGGNQVGGDFASTTTSYVDSTVVNNTTYYYAVTCVDANGHETTATPTPCLLYPYQGIYSVLGATANGSGGIRIQVASRDNLEAIFGGMVTIAGVTGTMEANGTWQIGVDGNGIITGDSTHFDLQNSVFTNAYISGGTVTVTNQYSRATSAVTPSASIPAATMYANIAWFPCTEPAVPIAITNALNNGSGNVRLTVTSTNGLLTGQEMSVFGVGGTTEANGFNAITVVDLTHIDLPVNFVHAYTSGGDIRPVVNRKDLRYQNTLGEQVFLAAFAVPSYLSPLDGNSNRLVGLDFTELHHAYLTTAIGSYNFFPGPTWRAWTFIEMQSLAFAEATNTIAGVNGAWQLYLFKPASTITLNLDMTDANGVTYTLACTTAYGSSPPAFSTGISGRLFMAWGYDGFAKKIVVDVIDASNTPYHWELPAPPNWADVPFAFLTLGAVNGGAQQFKGYMYQFGIMRDNPSSALLTWLNNSGAPQLYSSVHHVATKSSGVPPTIGWKVIVGGAGNTGFADSTVDPWLTISQQANLSANVGGLAPTTCSTFGLYQFKMYPIWSLAPTISSAHGNARYMLLTSITDHGQGGVATGYCNDPGILPTTLNQIIAPSTVGHQRQENPEFVWNPDTGLAHLYVTNRDASGVPFNPQNTLVYTTPDMSALTGPTVAIPISVVGPISYGLVAFTRVIRRGPNDWIAIHLGTSNDNSPNVDQEVYSLSTDGLVFPTLTGYYVVGSNNEKYNGAYGEGYHPFTANGNTYNLYIHGAADGGSNVQKYVTAIQLTPDANGNLIIGSSQQWLGQEYPGPYASANYVQDHMMMEEEGRLLNFPYRYQYHAANSVITKPLRAAVDLAVNFINDPAKLVASNVARPIGFTVTKLGNNAVLAWLDGGRHQNNRVYRSVSGGAFVRIADVTGLTYTDVAPGNGVLLQYYLTSHGVNSDTEGQPGATVTITL